MLASVDDNRHETRVASVILRAIYWKTTKDSELHFAARKKKLGLQSTINLITRGYSVNATNRNQETPLHIAARYNRKEIARVLLECGSSAYARNNRREKPLHVAGKHGHSEILEILLQYDCNPNSKNKDRRTPFDLAERYGHKGIQNPLKSWKEVRRIQLGRKYINPKRRSGMTPLVISGTKRKKESHGKYIYQKHKNKKTPLHIAAALGLVDVVESLIHSGLQLNEKDGNGNTPLHLAVISGRDVELNEFLRNEWVQSNKDGRLDHKYKEIVQGLIDGGAEVNARNLKEVTPLHFAVAAGCKDIIEMLLDQGANLNARDSKKRKPLLYVSYFSTDIFELLLSRGASFDQNGETLSFLKAEDGENVYIRNESWEIRLEFHVRNNTSDIIGESSMLELLDWAEFESRKMNEQCYGSDVAEALGVLVRYDWQMATESDGTALHFVAQYIHIHLYCDILETLLGSTDLNVNALNLNSQTPLHIAARRWNCKETSRRKLEERAIHLLLDRGANVNVKTRDGETALMLAAKMGCAHIVRILLASKKQTGVAVDVNTKDCDGETALIKSSKCLQIEVVKLLLESGASVMTHDNKGFTALHAAIFMPTYPNIKHALGNNAAIGEILKLLLDNFPDAASVADFCGNTALDLAMKSVNTTSQEDIDILRNYGCQLDTMLEKNESCFNDGDQLYSIDNFRVKHLATMINRLDIYKIRHFPDINERRDILRHAVSNPLFYTDIVRMALSLNVSWEQLLRMIKVEAENKRTILHYEAMHHSYYSSIGKLEIQSILICDVSVNAVDSYGRTPLHYVQNQETFNWLLANGADDDIKDFHGFRPRELLQYRSQDTTGKMGLYQMRGRGKHNVNESLCDALKKRDEDKYLTGINVRVRQPTQDNVLKIWKDYEFAIRHAGFKRLREKVEMYVKQLAENITLQDSRFECETKFVGSSFEETKINLPNEYDFNLVLTKLNLCCELFESPVAPPGFVHLKKVDLGLIHSAGYQSGETMNEFFDTSGFLLSEKVSTKFEMLLHRALASVRHDIFIWKKKCLDFWDTQDSKKKKTMMLRKEVILEMIQPFEGLMLESISIDIVPCVHLDGWWPEEATAEVRDELKAVGCNLVFGQLQYNYPWAPVYENYVRISFAVAESELIRESPVALKAAYMVAKQLIDKSKTYILKNALLYCIGAHQQQKTVIYCRESDDCDAIQLKDIRCAVHKLMSCYFVFHLHDFCPCYLMPSFVLPVDGFLKSKHMTAHLKRKYSFPANDNDLMRAFFDYLELCPHVSELNIPLPAPRPLCEHFDRESFLETLSRLWYSPDDILSILSSSFECKH